MGLVKRQATTKAVKVSHENFVGIKAQYLADIQSVVMMEEIPDDLIMHQLKSNRNKICSCFELDDGGKGGQAAGSRWSGR